MYYNKKYYIALHLRNLKFIKLIYLIMLIIFVTHFINTKKNMLCNLVNIN